MKSIFSNVVIEKITSEDQFEDQYESYEDGDFVFSICGVQLGIDFSTEFAQVLNCQCPETPNFFITEDREHFQASDLQKNGFNKAFLFPADKKIFEDTVLSLMSPDALKERRLKPVRIIDLGENEALGFDTHVFLPLNKKYVKFSSADDKFSDKKLQKLKKNHIGSVHIDQKDTKKFYEYSAKRLKNLGQDDTMSATEKEEKLTHAISGLFSDIFDSSQKDTFDSGKTLLATSQKIVSNYITNGINDNWYSNLVRTVGTSKGNYPHASEVSTYASLFAIGLQHKSPEDLALAGFLHDISLTDFPTDKPEEEWDEEQKAFYNEHPKASINAIKKKKMIINPQIEKAILDHHEMYNGKGFPKGKSGDSICEEAQILSFADQFQYLITVKEGEKRLSPYDVYKVIEANGSISPQILRKLKKLLTQES